MPKANFTANRSSDVVLTRPVSDADFDRARGLDDFYTNISISGTNSAISTSFEPIWEISTTADYPFPTTATAVRIAAGGNANDTAAGTGAQSVLVSGLDENWALATESIATNGISASSATTTTFIRINSVVVTAVGTYGGNNEGNITIEDSAGANTLGLITAGEGRTNQLVYSVPDGYTAYVKQWIFECSTDNSATIEAFLRQNGDDVTTPFSPAILTNKLVDMTGEFTIDIRNPIPIPGKSDFWMIAKKVTGGGSAQVSVVGFWTLEKSGV